MVYTWRTLCFDLRNHLNSLLAILNPFYQKFFFHMCYYCPHDFYLSYLRSQLRKSVQNSFGLLSHLTTGKRKIQYKELEGLLHWIAQTGKVINSPRFPIFSDFLLFKLSPTMKTHCFLSLYFHPHSL
jgi:hypothetical protein